MNFEVSKRCESRYFLYISKNAGNTPTLAIIAVRTAENVPLKILDVIQFNTRIHSPP